MSRPEHITNPEDFYNDEEALKYTNNTRVIQAQYELTERCIQILAIPKNKYPLILDIGCGSGLSGEVLTNHGYFWIGMDVSKSMLEINKENDSGNNLIRADMGQGVPFKPGVFDYAISVSALQWLCYSEKTSHNPIKRIKYFFQTLYRSLVLGARCCLQFYPENPEQMDLITKSALESGFTGGVVIDYPHSAKAKKYYLFITAGYNPETLNEVVKEVEKNKEKKEEVEMSKTVRSKRKNNKKAAFKSRKWIINKKSREEKRGKRIRKTTKYTGRKRRGHGIV